MTIFEIFFVTFQTITFGSWIALGFVFWKTKDKSNQRISLIIILIINFFMGCLIIQNNISTLEVEERKEESKITGEFWDIETVFKTEKNIPLRVWKRNLLEELLTNINNYRTQNSLSKIPLDTMESFSPQQLKTLFETKYDDIFLLDVREAVESDRFYIEGSQHVRYGDLANNIFPKFDPDKKIVVICYSGIRGFVTVNLLASKGYKNVAFIRGGLGQWIKEDLPIIGTEDDFKFLFQQYSQIPLEVVKNSTLPKIDFSFPEKFDDGVFPNMHNFYAELATTEETKDFIEKFIDQEVILVCKTESECFDGAAFAYLFEKNGGSVLGFIKL